LYTKFKKVLYLYNYVRKPHEESKIVLVNGLTKGVWLLTATDPYRTAVVVLVHVFGPVQLIVTTWRKSPLTSLIPPTEPVVMEQGLLGYLHCVRMLSAVFPPPLAVMAADVGGNMSEFW